MSSYNDDEMLAYHEDRQSMIDDWVEVGSITREELSNMSEKEVNEFLVSIEHDHKEGCQYCMKLVNIGLLEDREPNED